MTEKYSKCITDLGLTELLCYGLKQGLKKRQLTSIKKRDLLFLLYEKEPTFFDSDTRTFYFEKTGTMLKCLTDNPEHPEEYPQKFIGQQHKLAPAELKTQFDSENEEIKQEDLDVTAIECEAREEEYDRDSLGSVSNRSIKTEKKVQNNVSPSNSVIRNAAYQDEKRHGQTNWYTPAPIYDQHNANTLAKPVLNFESTGNNPHREKQHYYRQKLKYEPSHGIEAFIRSVEGYAEANDIFDRTKWIAIAKSALNASEDGLLIQDSLQPSEEQDWDLFKHRLLSILGNPPDYYRDLFRSLRRGSQKLGLVMSRLIQAYKRGFLSETTVLTESDKQHIMHQFIASLDNPLRGLLKAEEKKLTFSTIADRAAELERCFGVGFMPNSAASMMYPEARVQMVQAENNQKAENTIQLKMMELLNNMMTQSKEGHKELMETLKKQNSYKGPSQQPYKPRQRLDPELVKKLNGHCSLHVRDGICKRKTCTYIHADKVPEHIRNLFKN